MRKYTVEGVMKGAERQMRELHPESLQPDPFPGSHPTRMAFWLQLKSREWKYIGKPKRDFILKWRKFAGRSYKEVIDDPMKLYFIAEFDRSRIVRMQSNLIPAMTDLNLQFYYHPVSVEPFALAWTLSKYERRRILGSWTYVNLDRLTPGRLQDYVTWMKGQTYWNDRLVKANKVYSLALKGPHNAAAINAARAVVHDLRNVGKL